MAQENKPKYKEGRDDKGRFTLSNMWWKNRSRDGVEPKYTDPAEMAKVIGEYLSYEEENSKGKYTIEGCALFLGFSSRESFYDYLKKPDFSYILSRFKLFMVHYHAQRLTWAGSFQGSQFWLRNWGGYTDESVVNQNQTINKVVIEEKTRDDK